MVSEGNSEESDCLGGVSATDLQRRLLTDTTRYGTRLIAWLTAADAAWCERGDSNPHGDYPSEPKSGASTNSATFAGSPALYPRCNAPDTLQATKKASGFAGRLRFWWAVKDSNLRPID